MKRWYDYESGENKIGTVYFEPVITEDGHASDQVSCQTEITYRSLKVDGLRRTTLDDPEEHKWLADLFLAELLASPPIG